MLRTCRGSDADPPFKISGRTVRPFLPYGAYLTEDGEIVMFDRRYRPIFRRDKGGTVHPDDRARWVDGICGHVWFYSDVTLTEAEVMHRCQIIMARWAAAGMTRGRAARNWLLPRQWIHNRQGS